MLVLLDEHARARLLIVIGNIRLFPVLQENTLRITKNNCKLYCCTMQVFVVILAV
jgi:hypothetical protein